MGTKTDAIPPVLGSAMKRDAVDASGASAYERRLFPPCSHCSGTRSVPIVHVQRFSSVFVFCSMTCYSKFLDEQP